MSSLRAERTATAELNSLLRAMPPARRGAALQHVVSFRPSHSLDASFDVGRLRAAFANHWEQHTGRCVPIEALRAVLEPPVPIATVLAFSRLMLVRDECEMDAALDAIVQHLLERLRETLPEPQLELFAEEKAEQSSIKSELPVGDTVTQLDLLVEQGRKFPTVYADPPWQYENEASRAAAVNHYPTMSVDAICKEPVSKLAADNAHLHLWTTNAFLCDAFDVLESWGFEFKSCLVWVKDEIGMGNYWRVSHEFLLLGVRGSLTFRDRTLPSWIRAHRTSHSRKPGVVRALIERVSPGPYLELYGREELPNSAWTVYGNQVERRLF